MIQILMMRSRRRLKRERTTVLKMIGIFCRGHHGLEDGSSCVECDELKKYVLARLERCPFQEGKPVCNRCPVHCYRPDIREQIKAVMRYSGPRMFFRHPVLTAFHFIDAHRAVPELGKTESRSAENRRSG